MVKSSKGLRKRTRSIMRKTPRSRGMPPITRSFVKYEVGDKAAVVIEPSVHGGQPHVRFQGHTGIIIGKQGKAYLLRVTVGHKEKDLIISPEHLRKQDG
ncbi:MAG: 50S ribosomal protein L21e [Candidatus Dadabacteria bacterium]|nr:50S ribosomal protein L21e [Candidatus Dadabacteria bacterium]